MTSFINSLLNSNEGSRIAVVSHGASIKFLLMNWCSLNQNFDLVYNDTILKIDSPSVIELEFNKDSLLNLSQLY